MKNMLVLCMMVISIIETRAQGVIALSNVNKQPVTFNGRPVGSDWVVSFALPDGTLLGWPANILGQGIFSAGPQALDGIAGEVDLSVAAWSTNSPSLVGISDPFSVTLGDMENPADIPPDFSGVHIVIPEPETLSLVLIAILAVGFRSIKARALHCS